MSEEITAAQKFKQLGLTLLTFPKASDIGIDYSYELVLTSPLKPNPNSQVKIFDARNDFVPREFDFEEWRFQETLRIRSENMVAHLKQEGVHDYHVAYGQEETTFRFPSQWAANIAKMLYLEEKPYVLELAPEDPNIPMKQARKIVHAVKTNYEEVNPGNRIKFKFDTATKGIRIIAPTRREYVDFLGEEYSINLHA